MITLVYAFWLLVGIFALIGAMRGWAKEILVTFSVILSLFILNIIQIFPPIKAFFASGTASSFWVQAGLLFFMVLFGYQTPNLPRFASGKLAREKLSDGLLGFFLGGINGFLIVGSIWYFMIAAHYPLPGVTPPPVNPQIVHYLPPVWLVPPLLYFVVMIAFVFVLVVFL